MSPSDSPVSSVCTPPTFVTPSSTRVTRRNSRSHSRAPSKHTGTKPQTRRVKTTATKPSLTRMMTPRMRKTRRRRDPARSSSSSAGPAREPAYRTPPRMCSCARAWRAARRVRRRSWRGTTKSFGVRWRVRTLRLATTRLRNVPPRWRSSRPGTTRTSTRTSRSTSSRSVSNRRVTRQLRMSVKCPTKRYTAARSFRSTYSSRHVAGSYWWTPRTR